MTPDAGAITTPMTGVLFFTRAMLTVNSPLRLINSLVPSIGSTIQSLSQCFLVSYGMLLPSSERMGILLSCKIEDIIL